MDGTIYSKDSYQQFLGVNSGIQIICSRNTGNEPVSGIVQSWAAQFIRFGDFSAVVHVGVTSIAATGSSMITISVSAAPTSQYGNEILNTYLPIAWQLLFTNGGKIDRDGDGVPDDEDRFPDDPSRQ